MNKKTIEKFVKKHNFKSIEECLRYMQIKHIIKEYDRKKEEENGNIQK